MDETMMVLEFTLITLIAVMNLTEMESMVREATNADPWGAPSKISTDSILRYAVTDRCKALLWLRLLRAHTTSQYITQDD